MGSSQWNNYFSLTIDEGIYVEIVIVTSICDRTRDKIFTYLYVFYSQIKHKMNPNMIL